MFLLGFSATTSAAMDTVPSATMADAELWSEKDVETMEMENVFRKMNLSQKVPTKMICMEHAKRAAMVQIRSERDQRECCDRR